jgi:uncharacterized protein with FMN-binding domain
MDTASTPTGSSKTPLIIGLIVIAVIAAGAFAFTRSDSSQSAQTQTQTDTAMGQPESMEPTAFDTPVPPGGTADGTATGTESAMEASDYQDGQYEATGSYTSPAGPEEVKITLTLKDGVVEATEFEGMAENPISVKLQGQFASGYEALVVGKNIDEIQLDKVSGSSLTPKGFNDAVSKIKEQARG